MFGKDDYLRLSTLDEVQMRNELIRAQQHRQYWQDYLDGAYTQARERIDYDRAYIGIKSCEQYAIEIERRLGVYDKPVAKMLLRYRHKALQSHGLRVTNAFRAKVAQTKPLTPTGLSKFRKCTFKKKHAC